MGNVNAITIPAVPTCAICETHSTNRFHSMYFGHPIIKADSWITRSVHYHSDIAEADTLAGIKAKIRDTLGLA